MRHWMNLAKSLTAFTQFGLSLVTPLLLCLGLCMWLSQGMGVGGWVYIPGFFFGMGGSAMVAYKFYLGIIGKQEKEKKKKRICFNRHI